MQSQSDAQLLRKYAEQGSEPAFTKLVQRHTNLVYSAALRQVESPDIAAEITQSVFISLARTAKNLAPKLMAEASLAGWLCRSARNQALNHRRDEFRRVTRERHAMEQILPALDTAPDWEKLRPVLDETMAELNETDYDALVLRFYQSQDFHTVGAAIGVSDDTAQKRVTRALDKLRDLLARRGIRTTTGALGIVITANAVQAAPVGLALTISTATALTGTTLATTATVTATKAIAMTTLQKTVITATIAALAGVGIYEARQASQLRQQVQTLQQQQAPLAKQIQQLLKEHGDATSQVAGLREDNERLSRNSSELLKLRGEIGTLRGQLVGLQQEYSQFKARASQPGETPATEIAQPTDFPKDGWIFAGYATPEAALQTWTWAMSRGDKQTMLNSLTVEARKEWEQIFASQDDQKIAADSIQGLAQVSGYKIVDRGVVSQSEMWLAISVTPMNASEAKEGSMKMTLHKVGAEWKVAGPSQH